MTGKIKASDIRSAMDKSWRAPEWAIMWEVGEATGAMSGRYADAVMMSLWPSRGLELHGVEIKVSRSDWKREAADPSKAEAIARFCDRWWVHTSPGVVDDVASMPPAWGLREWDGKRWKVVKDAERTDAAPISRPFLAAMLRRADGAMRAMVKDAMREAEDKLYQEVEKRRERFAKEVDDAVKRRTAALAAGSENFEKFEAAFGVSMGGCWNTDFDRIGRAARALSDIGPGGYNPLISRLRAAADEIESLQQIVAEAADVED